MSLRKSQPLSPSPYWDTCGLLIWHRVNGSRGERTSRPAVRCGSGFSVVSTKFTKASGDTYSRGQKKTTSPIRYECWMTSNALLIHRIHLICSNRTRATQTRDAREDEEDESATLA